MKVIYKDGRCKMLNDDLTCKKKQQDEKGTCYVCSVHKEIDHIRHTLKDRYSEPNYNLGGKI